jgi:hypothetical protein
MSAEAHLCRGPDAGQLLGFLCSLGLLEAATRSLPEHRVRLAFAWRDIGFRPLLSVEPAVDRETLVASLHAWIGQRANSRELSRLGKDLPCAAAEFEALARQVLSDGASAALLAAFGVAHPGSDRIDDTAFRTMSGTGHQHFLDFARQIAEETTPAHIERCLFEPWTYEDPRPSLRFDPTDDRRYALRSDDPANASSIAPIRTVRAANALAFEGLALVPVMPTAGGPATTLFTRDGRAMRVSWPLWERPLGTDAAASLLASARFTGPGIVAVFSARRLTVGKYRSFTPAERVALAP